MTKTKLVNNGMPLAMRSILQVMGENCALARKRRGMTQDEAGKRVFVSRPTIANMEKGEPSVSLGTYLSYAFILGMEKDFGLLFAPERDKTGMWLERRKMDARKRIRKKAEPDLEF